MLDHDEVVRLYGPWRARTPADAIALFDGYDGPWWIAGGWAIEAFTDVRRAHGDLDPSIPRGAVGGLREHLAGRLDVWAADQGALRPLLPSGSVAGDALPRSCSNLWLRRGGADPWEFDVLLMDVADGVWTYERHPRISRPLDEVLWTRGSIRYLRPEVQLLYKAPGLRPVDQADFDVCAPVLDPPARDWLVHALDLAHPGHPWTAALRSDAVEIE